MEVQSILWLLLGVFACSEAYTVESAIYSTMLNDEGSNDVGEARKVLPDPETESGAKKALPPPKFPYMKGKSTNSSHTKKAARKPHDPVAPLDFNKALLDSMKNARVKPPCSTSSWSAWGLCKPDCERNQISQTGVAYKSRTRTLYQAGESKKEKRAETQGEKADVLWKKRIADAEQVANQTGTDTRHLEISTRKEISRLATEKAGVYEISGQVKIDIEIAKLETRVTKMKKRADQASLRVVKVKQMARVVKEKQAEEATDSEAALARAVNAPPYCKAPSLVEKRECEAQMFCPIDCKVSEWEPWPACRADHCSLEFASQWTTHHRERTVLREAHYGGSKCPFAIEQQPCSDVSCVWKVTEESRFKLTRCADLLEAKQFGKWSQQWVIREEMASLQTVFTAMVEQLARHTETLQIVDAFHRAMKHEIISQCRILRSLPTVLSMPPGKSDIMPVCMRGMRKMCKHSRWPIKDSCGKLATNGCKQLQKSLQVHLNEFHERVSLDRSEVTAAAGKQLWAQCYKLRHFSVSMMDSMFGSVDLRHQQLELLSKVQTHKDKLDALADDSAQYHSTSFRDEKGNVWACTRKWSKDLREQNFECMKSVRGPYQGIMCKGTQVGRLLYDKTVDQCRQGSNPSKLVRFGGETDGQYEVRGLLSDTIAGCSCPAGHSLSNTQCCRAGEIPVTQHAVNVKPVVQCQCPDGMEFISVAAKIATWRFQCQPLEHEVGKSECDDMSMLKTSASICCRRVVSQCQPKCQEHQFRLFDGICVSPAMYGCYRYDVAAYKAGKQPVSCLLPISESILTEKDCEGSAGGGIWTKNETNSSFPIGQPYCKRNQNVWTTLYTNCSFSPQVDPTNSFHCGAFEASSFNHPVKRQTEAKAEYFSFVSQSVLFGAGTPSTAMGLGKPTTDPEAQELPLSYIKFNPLEDMVTEDKGDKMAEKMAAQNPAEVVELLQISEPRKQMPPFLVVTTQFGMTSWDDNMATNPDDVTGPDTDDLPKRRLFAKMEDTATFDPIEDGSSNFKQQMSQLQGVTKDYDIAMGTHATPTPIAGSQHGSQARICVPPPDIATCLSGYNPHKCLAPVDMAWFRTQCAKL